MKNDKIANNSTTLIYKCLTVELILLIVKTTGYNIISRTNAMSGFGFVVLQYQ